MASATPGVTNMYAFCLSESGETEADGMRNDVVDWPGVERGIDLATTEAENFKVQEH